jgi:hypothetical protein
MVTIQLDDTTAKALEIQAQNAGLSLVDFLKTLASETMPRPRGDWDAIEREIVALSSDGPTLPADFSRADIYNDHD